MLGYADDEIEPHVSAWERLLHPDDMAARAGGERQRRARRARPTRASSACATRTATTSTCCRAAFRSAANPADRSSASSARTSISPSARQAEAERARTELLSRLVFAQEDERRRIAREMHDQFGEQLTALGRGIDALKDACRADRRPARAGRRARGRSRSSSIATSISSSGSCGRRRSTISACARRWPTTSRTGRGASASRPSCTRRGSSTIGWPPKPKRRSIASRRKR